MQKIILQKARAMMWETLGVFDSIEDVQKCVEEMFGVTYEQDQLEYGEMSIEEWLSELECQIIKTKQQ